MASPSTYDGSWFAQGHGGSRVWNDSPATSPVEAKETIQWAAMEKLLEEQGMRQNLLDNALARSEHDTEQLLLHIKERIDRVGIEVPTVEVRFEHLSVEAEVYVGDRALPSLLNFTRDMFEDMLASCRVLPSNKRPFTILQDISGVIKPGRMTLLLGPPGDSLNAPLTCDLLVETFIYVLLVADYLDKIAVDCAKRADNIWDAATWEGSKQALLDIVTKTCFVIHKLHKYHHVLQFQPSQCMKA